jgi:hypothetical protein
LAAARAVAALAPPSDATALPLFLDRLGGAGSAATVAARLVLGAITEPHSFDLARLSLLVNTHNMRVQYRESRCEQLPTTLLA